MASMVIVLRITTPNRLNLGKPKILSMRLKIAERSGRGPVEPKLIKPLEAGSRTPD